MKNAILLLATSIAATPASAAPREGPVRIGQVAAVNGPRVRPDAIVEDSRCPARVTCIWAGRVVIDATIYTGRGAHRQRLTLGTPVQVADGDLTLRAVTPTKRGDARPIRPRDYRFTFAFAGGL